MPNEHEHVIPKLPFHLSILNNPKLSSLLHTDTQLFTKILDALKQYEPYSAPFLYRVSKREVPNYHEIIKTPMDLSLMSRNVKKYNRETFKRDLDLIWTNCHTFNGPSIYTDYAEKLKSRADYLYDFYFESTKSNKENTKAAKYETTRVQEDINYFMEEAAKQCKDIYMDVYPLDGVHFSFHDLINIGSFSKRQRKDMPVLLDSFSSKHLLEQIIVVTLHKIGFTHLQTDAIKIFSDVLYYKLFVEAKKLDNKIVEKISKIKCSDLNLFVAKYSIHSESENRDDGSEEIYKVEKEIDNDDDDVLVINENNSPEEIDDVVDIAKM